MKIFQLLQAMGGPVTPNNCKVHLAVHNGIEEPKDVYLRGEFESWQNRQKNKNFERPYVLALIRLPNTLQWLFAGCYKKSSPPISSGDGYYSYDLKPMDEYQDLAGRLIVTYDKKYRQSYPYGETVVEAELAQILEKKLSVSEFRGFKNVRLPFNHLETIVKSKEPTWRSALSSVGGVYVISDPGAGKLYVGSAYGTQGIWGRWCQYTSGHGNNKMLKELVEAEGVKRAAHFWFSVLETIDIGASPEDVIARENHWKEVLLTRQGGYNASESRRSAKEGLDQMSVSSCTQ